MSEFEVRGNTYLFVKQSMDAMTQFHVICKFGPAMKLSAQRGGTTLLETFAALSDEDREFVVSRCLGSVKKKSGTGWAVVWDKQANALLFQDMNALDLLDISTHVMEQSFRDFFPERPSDLSDELPDEDQDTNQPNYQAA